MANTPMYFLQILGNPTIEISQDDLRSLLGEIEAELHSSQVYRHALASVQQLFGDSAEQGKMLLKAVGREAIGLAFRQLVQQYRKVQKTVKKNTDNQPQTETTSCSQDLPQDNSNDLLQCLTNTKLNTKSNRKNVEVDNLSPPPDIVTNTTHKTVISTENAVTAKTPLAWFKNKKISNAELTKQTAAEQRIECLRQIGQQLRLARESQSLSLHQLNVYTHVPVYQMEAIENGNWELLPEDVFVRGFIRVMGNALGLNGTALAASLPKSEPVKSILPSWYESKKSSQRLGWEIRPIHLYVGYTALVASAVGGLSLLSDQSSTTDRLIYQDASATTPASSVWESLKQQEVTTIPGIKSSDAGITVGPDISPPETL
ncbi:MAG: helix-turn-helix domain-containing protein [Fischerella sp.]|nr:helix-turn-helix domain-containing protein [Fischerella sp.]